MKSGANRRMNASCLACPANLEDPRLEGCKDCFTNSSVVIKVMPSPSQCLPPGRSSPRWHELNDLNAGLLQLEPQRLGVGVNRRLGGGIDWRGGSGTKASPEDTLITVPLCGEDVDERGGHADYAAHVDVQSPPLAQRGRPPGP